MLRLAYLGKYTLEPEHVLKDFVKTSKLGYLRCSDCDGSEPYEIGIDEYELDEIRDLWTVTGLTDSQVTRKGIYIACSPSTLLVP
jgi:hypothetical protein